MTRLTQKSYEGEESLPAFVHWFLSAVPERTRVRGRGVPEALFTSCLLYTYDAADE